MKPRLYVLNGKVGEIDPQILETFKKNDWNCIVIDILGENEAQGLTDQEKKGIRLTNRSKIERADKKILRIIKLDNIFTTGPDETRAWTLKKGSTAPQAGGVIHTDFERAFIRAEVVNWQALLTAGGFSEAKSKALLATVGKDYVVQDGDVIEIKANA